ncbi:universal stress protein [Blastochloris viridis]|nr:universal stress protein [Blastochloris viridis]
MSLKTVIVLVDASPESMERARQAVSICQRFGAHLIGVFVSPPGWARVPAESFAIGSAAIQAVIQRWKALQNDATDDAFRAFETSIRNESVSFEFRAVLENEISDFLYLHCLHADLVIAGVRQFNALPSFAPAIEAQFASSGTPMLLIPEDWKGGDIGARVMLGWNASREARRAIIAAMPFFNTAQAMHVVVVDAAKNSRLGEEPGSDVALLLSRHGIDVTLNNLVSHGRAIANVLLEFAAQNALDLIVIGAYSHSMTRERLFGGVTKTLLQRSSVPLLAVF